MSSSICKAKIQNGPRKGQSCTCPPSENGYCGRHERNREYDEGILQGKKWCRFFFRGCNNQPISGLTCNTCKEKKYDKYVGVTFCRHKEGCKFRTNNTDYCKKHERDIYYDKECEIGIKYCDIARGCYTILSNGCSKCDDCLEKARNREKALFDKRTTLQNALKSINSTQRICVDCGSNYEAFLTKNNTDSKRCPHCNEIVVNQDKKRVNRERNQKEEANANKTRYYKEYIKNAIKRDYEMNLSFDEFCKLITQPCHYCNYSKENEVNGIDRVDNTKGYFIDNTVPCCEMCNKMKHDYPVGFFLEKCNIIGTGKFPTREFYVKWSKYYDKKTVNKYSAYKSNAVTQRGFFFELTKAEWDNLMIQPCYLCGFHGNTGIDRIDSSVKGYSMTNCRSCCSSCNFMKLDYNLDIFRTKCKDIIEHLKTHTPLI